jgi:hypothetical protein
MDVKPSNNFNYSSPINVNARAGLTELGFRPSQAACLHRATYTVEMEQMLIFLMEIRDPDPSI